MGNLAGTAMSVVALGWLITITPVKTFGFSGGERWMFEVRDDITDMGLEGAIVRLVGATAFMALYMTHHWARASLLESAVRGLWLGGPVTIVALAGLLALGVWL